MIKLDNVYIQKDQKLILKNINLKINDKEKVFVIGSSGAGKTTLINSFMDSSIIKKGNIFINDINIKKINKKQMKKINSNYGFLSQKDFFINWETAYFNIKNLYPKYKNNFYKFFNIINKEQKKEIFQIAKKLKIEDILFKKISDISGGEKQRIKILLLFIQKPSIILADEPTTSLDLKISKEIIEKICSFKDSLLIINIHKLDLIPDDAKRIIGIKNGLIIFDGSKKDLSKKIEEIYE